VKCLAIVGDLECLAIVGDLDPEPDPHVFGTSGSVSISQRYGSEIRIRTTGLIFFLITIQIQISMDPHLFG